MSSWSFDWNSSKKDDEYTADGKLDLGKFYGKPFYCWDDKKFGLHDCCFNHIVGLPLGNKDGKEKPFWEYHKKTIDALFDDSFQDRKKRRHVRVKKATGLAFSELGIRLISWLALSSNIYRNTQIAIVNGPNIDVSVALMRRLRGIFSQNLGIELKGKETRVTLNGCNIQAYPSNNLASYRGLANVKFILLDEADFFGEKRKEDMWEVRYTTERYIAKSNPYIMMVSTPNRPGFLYETMDHEDEEKSLYQLLEFNYEYGLPPNGDVFTIEQINDSKNSFTFGREYDLKYLGEIGNVFSELKIKAAILNGKRFDIPNPLNNAIPQSLNPMIYRQIPQSPNPQILGIPLNPYSVKNVGIDPGFGSSRTAVTVTEWLQEYQMLRVIGHNEFDRPNPEAIADLAFSLQRIFGNCWYYVDGSNAGFVRELKARFGENSEWEKDDISEDNMKVIPVNFATDHKRMLSHLHVLVNKELIAIPERFDMLITAMSTAIAKEYNLDKTKTSYDDSLDSLRLAAYGIRSKNNG